MTPAAPAAWERRAWAPSFPGLGPPGEAEPWGVETYLLPLGLAGRNIKIRGGEGGGDVAALEMKDLVVQRGDLQLWQPAARLPFPIPAHLVERELIVRLALGQPLRRERFTVEDLLADLALARGNVVVVRLRKRRRLFEAAGCRAEVGEVEIDGRRILTACIEHPEADRVALAATELGIDRYPNLDYPSALARLAPMLRRHAVGR